MYQLYYADGSASMGVRVLLEEIGAPYTLLDSSIELGGPRPVEQLKVNPNGWIPVLLWDQDGTSTGAMYEAAAITIFLCDRHPETRLAPASDHPDRALYLQTLVYCSSAVQTAFQQFYYPDRFADSADDIAGVRRRGLRRLAETWRVLDEQIGQYTWVLGDDFSAVDIYLYMISTWFSPEMGGLSLEDFPNAARLARAAAERPSIRHVYGT